MKSLTPEQLLSLYKDANAKAFDRFFAISSRLVYGFLLLKIGDRNLANKTLFKTYQHLHDHISSYPDGEPALLWTLSLAKGRLLELKEAGREATKLSKDELLAVAKELRSLVLALPQSESETLLRRIFSSNDPYFEQALLQRPGSLGRA